MLSNTSGFDPPCKDSQRWCSFAEVQCQRLQGDCIFLCQLGGFIKKTLSSGGLFTKSYDFAIYELWNGPISEKSHQKHCEEAGGDTAQGQSSSWPL